MMEESLEAILALLTSDEPVSRKTDWFILEDARLQLRPYSHPCFEVAVAAQVSPSGPRAAGRFGLSLLSLGATSTGGFDVLGSHWKVMEQRAEEFNTQVDRRNWRLVGPMHVAETEEQARADVAHGLPQWMDYFARVAALPVAPETAKAASLDDMIDAMNNSGLGVIGTPDQAAAQIDRLIGQSGGFGSFLFMAHEWADRQATLKNYELFAREVAPRFQGSLRRAVGSRDWAAERRPEFMNAAGHAVLNAIQDHATERAEKKAATQDPPVA